MPILRLSKTTVYPMRLYKIIVSQITIFETMEIISITREN